jgi:acyl-coenzyme A synthetase/AMP-(fatty) acid ligase
VLESFRRYGTTLTFLPPTVIYLLMEAADDAPCPTLRNLVYGGGPMRPARIRAAQERFGPVLATSYGQTEAPQIITVVPAD